MKTPALLTLPCLLLSACAGLIGPSSETINQLPVVTYGQPMPESGEFVLRYPAGTDLPVVASVDGSLLAKSARTQMNVQIKQDIYLYGNQLSFDGKTWQSATSRVGGRFWLTLPGEKDGKLNTQSPGELGAEFNLR